MLGILNIRLDTFDDRMAGIEGGARKDLKMLEYAHF